MKKNNIIKAVAILCIMNCALCITSCSQEENANDGKYPLELKATGISVDQTRAVPDGTWTGNEVLGLMVSGDNNVYRYTADNEGNLTSTSPYYWQNTDDITVTAWYPYSASSDGTKFSHTVNDDQSSDENYNSSDLIVASNKTVSFAKSEIAFEHQTSKITVSLTWGTEFTDEEKDKARVEIYDGTQYIAPNCSIKAMMYRAVIMPVKLNANTDFIKVTVGKASFYYALAAQTSFDKNNSYTYSITVKKTGLELTGCTIKGWQDNEISDNALPPRIINFKTAGTLTDDELKEAIADGDGNVIITGSLNQSDLDIVFNHRNEYTTLYMSGATVSGEDITFGTYTEESYIDDCTSLKSVSLPQGLTSIGEAAFCYCTSLTSITIPSSVTSIGEDAFDYCTSLTSITIPSSVTKIGEYAFWYCTSLNTVICESETPPTCGNGVFNSHPNDFTIYVPASSVDEYKTASGWSTYSDYITAITTE